MFEWKTATKTTISFYLKIWEVIVHFLCDAACIHWSSLWLRWTSYWREETVLSPVVENVSAPRWIELWSFFYHELALSGTGVTHCPQKEGNMKCFTENVFYLCIDQITNSIKIVPMCTGFSNWMHSREPFLNMCVYCNSKLHEENVRFSQSWRLLENTC